MIIIYYSRGSPLPALMAAMKHCRPALSPEQAWCAAAAWGKEHPRGDEQPFSLERIGDTSAGEIVCMMTAKAPPAMIKRTFDGLSKLMGTVRVLTAIYPFSWSRPGKRRNLSARRREAFWGEIEALVERTRLQARLIKER